MENARGARSAQTPPGYQGDSNRQTRGGSLGLPADEGRRSYGFHSRKRQERTASVVNLGPLSMPSRSSLLTPVNHKKGTRSMSVGRKNELSTSLFDWGGGGRTQQPDRRYGELLHWGLAVDNKSCSRRLETYLQTLGIERLTKK